MRGLTSVLTWVVLLAVAAIDAAAQSENWRRMAEEDLAAAYALLAENHPAAAEAAGDAEFRAQLQSGHAEARALARDARTFGGYRAAIERFAAAFGDPHIGSSSLVQANRFWPGFLVGMRGDRWEVVASGDDKAPPVAATLVSCDGRGPDELATSRLAPFTPSWNVRAQRIDASTSLLLDTGNPHHPRLTACTFRTADGATIEHRLVWRQASSAELAPHLRTAGRRASREVFLRPFEGGWWIRLGTSTGAAAPIVARAEKEMTALRSAAFVVVDLRGNDGGASFISDRLAAAIFGSARMEAALKAEGLGETETVVWRASAGNLAALNAYLDRGRQALGPDDPLVLGLAAQRDATTRALADKLPLSKAPGVVRRTPAPLLPDPATPPRVFVVTDTSCFSSCLLAVRLFRSLGALHVGAETRANTRYSNARSIDLPSGLSNFYTLMAFPLGAPKPVGPFTPAVVWDGNLADDELVFARMRELVRLGQ